MGGCEWMERRELSRAIPPAYSRYIAQAHFEQLPNLERKRAEWWVIDRFVSLVPGDWK